MTTPRSPDLPEIRARVTNVMILVQLGIAATYLFTPPVRVEGRALVVAYIEGLGPIWIFLFGAAGTFLLYSRLTARHLVEAHTWCFGSSVMYSGALWASVFLGSPFLFSIAAWASMAVAAAHYAMSRWYAARGA